MIFSNPTEEYKKNLLQRDFSYILVSLYNNGNDFAIPSKSPCSIQQVSQPAIHSAGPGRYVTHHPRQEERRTKWPGNVSEHFLYRKDVPRKVRSLGTNILHSTDICRMEHPWHRCSAVQSNSYFVNLDSDFQGNPFRHTTYLHKPPTD